MHPGSKLQWQAFCSSPHGAEITNESAASRIYSTLIKLAFVQQKNINSFDQPCPHTHTKKHTPAQPGLTAASHTSRFNSPVFLLSWPTASAPIHDLRIIYFLMTGSKNGLCSTANKKWTLRRLVPEMYLFCRSASKTRLWMKSNIDPPWSKISPTLREGLRVKLN